MLELTTLQYVNFFWIETCFYLWFYYRFYSIYKILQNGLNTLKIWLNICLSKLVLICQQLQKLIQNSLYLICYLNRLKCQTDSKIHCWKLKKHIHSSVSRVQSGKLSNFPVAYWCILYLIWRQSEIPLENIMFGTVFFFLFFSFTFFFLFFWVVAKREARSSCFSLICSELVLTWQN